MRALELYIHIPFCISKCAYCDFYSITDKKLQSEYISSLSSEIERQIGLFPEKKVSTVFVGGGTPTSLPTNLLEKLFSTIQKLNLERNAEITIECNPGTIDHEKARALRSFGVNRVSLGVQSMNDDELALLGRIHTSAEAKKAIEIVSEAGFDNINCDVIFALPGKTKDKLEATLSALTSLDIKHTSLYALQLEKGTPLYRNRTDYSFPDDETQLDLYLRSVDLLAKYGFAQYEISNFAKKGFECRHNLGYWTGADYIGIGPSAYSFEGGRRYHYERDIEKFISSPEIIEDETVGESERKEEEIMLSLRLARGIKKERLITLSSSPDAANLAEKYISLGLAKEKDGRFALTPEGMFVSNSIISSFI